MRRLASLLWVKGSGREDLEDSRKHFSFPNPMISHTATETKGEKEGGRGDEPVAIARFFSTKTARPVFQETNHQPSFRVAMLVEPSSTDQGSVFAQACVYSSVSPPRQNTARTLQPITITPPPPLVTRIHSSLGTSKSKHANQSAINSIQDSNISQPRTFHKIRSNFFFRPFGPCALFSVVQQMSIKYHL